MFLALTQGDTCNLIGCLLTGNQLKTQVYTAMCAPSLSTFTLCHYARPGFHHM